MIVQHFTREVLLNVAQELVSDAFIRRQSCLHVAHVAPMVGRDTVLVLV